MTRNCQPTAVVYLVHPKNNTTQNINIWQTWDMTNCYMTVITDNLYNLCNWCPAMTVTVEW